MQIIFIPLILTLVSVAIVMVNFLVYIVKGELITGKKLWTFIQIWTVLVLPIVFLSFMDLPNKNDCCSDTAIFSPDHRWGIYILIFLCMAAFVIQISRTNILAPVAELLLNVFLVLGLVLNILFCVHFTTVEDDFFWWLFGNTPIILLFLMALSENQKLIGAFIEENEYSSNSFIGKGCSWILTLHPILKYPILSIAVVPVLILLSLFLLLFGQKPDSIIAAFTDTYKHGFSQLDHMCDNIDCGGHFLCSVGANGHTSVVKPIRYGERNGHKIICTRQLLVSNAFEDLMQEKFPRTHKIIRQQYNKVGNVIHQHYHIFNNKVVSDIVYVCMKPLELLFLLTLYSFDKKPENRIAIQYLNNEDRQKINGIRLRS